MALRSISLLTILLVSLLMGCASREHVADEYGEAFKKKAISTSKRTVVFFLVDGLPLQMMNQAINSGALPNIKNYFVGGKKRFYVARTAFPSLTFPGIGSLLAEAPVDQHGIYGNVILKDDDKIDFQSPSKFHVANKMIGGHNIFSRLKAKGLKTVSLDYSFTSDADIHISPQDIEAGLAVLGKDYSYVDKKLIDSLELLLTENKPETWPDFIFVHLIGVDLTSHDKGPQSQETKEYLESLDSKLSSVFSVLNNAEAKRERQVIAFLSADHGFDSRVEKVLHLEKAIKRLDQDIKMIDEGRYAALYLPPAWKTEKKALFMQGLAANPLIDIVAHRDGENIYVKSGTKESTVVYGKGACAESSYTMAVLNNEAPIVRAAGNSWSCPEKLDAGTNSLYYPYFLANISHYFQAVSHPDAIVIPKSGIAFNSLYLGQHGGPTPQEIYVPLLIHNGVLTDGQQVPGLWELLKFM
jgi:hypothetical protein